MHGLTRACILLLSLLSPGSLLVPSRSLSWPSHHAKPDWWVPRPTTAQPSALCHSSFSPLVWHNSAPWLHFQCPIWSLSSHPQTPTFIYSPATATQQQHKFTTQHNTHNASQHNTPVYQHENTAPARFRLFVSACSSSSAHPSHTPLANPAHFWNLPVPDDGRRTSSSRLQQRRLCLCRRSRGSRRIRGLHSVHDEPPTMTLPSSKRTLTHHL